MTQRSYPGALFLSAGGYHHHLGINTWAGVGAPPSPPDAVGLVSFALQLPERESWATLMARVRGAGIDVEREGWEDGTLRALIRDPDGTGVELVTSL